MPNGSVIHRFAETAKFFPERAALFTEGRHYSYREMSALAQGIRNGLIESGFAGPARIGVLNGTDACSYASVLAILANGAAYVPLDDRNSSDVNARIIDDAALDVVLVSGMQEAAGRIEAALPPDVEVMRTTNGDSDLRSSTSLDVTEIAADALAYITYTLDAEQRPIGVPTYHRNLNSFLDALLDPGSCDFGRNDRFLQRFELCAERSVASWFAALSVGGCCYVAAEEGSAEDVLRLLAEHRLTVALMTPPHPAALSACAEIPSLRHSVFFGPVVSPHFIEQWSEAAPNSRIQTVYGRAEATVYCLSREWDRGGHHPDREGAFTIGTPLPRVEAFIVDGNGHAAPGGETGVLCLRGAQVSGHYWNDPCHAAAAFFDVIHAGRTGKAWRTNDVCSMNEQGAFVFHGRATDSTAGGGPA
jgi:non-ribosomal peptide synthetase component F